MIHREPRNTFRKAQRLTGSGDFRHTLFRGQRRKLSGFTIYVTPASSTQLGISIPKKQVRLASARNRIKRLIRESFRKNARNLAPCHIVVLGHKTVQSLSAQEINQLLEQQWLRLKSS